MVFFFLCCSCFLNYFSWRGRGQTVWLSWFISLCCLLLWVFGPAAQLLRRHGRRGVWSAEAEGLSPPGRGRALILLFCGGEVTRVLQPGPASLEKPCWCGPEAGFPVGRIL